MYVRSDIATADATISDIDLVKAGAGPWFLSTTHDLAIRFFGSAITSPLPTVIPISAFLTDRGQLNVGADLLVLGFPLGLRGQHYEAVVARRAMVASVGAKYTLLDAFVFPGNSGGPVVYAP